MAELSIARAAVALGVDVATIRWRIERGVLPARQTGDGRWLVSVPAEAAMRVSAPSRQLDHVDALLQEAQLQLTYQTSVMEGLLKAVDILRDSVWQSHRDVRTAVEDLSRLRLVLAKARDGLVVEGYPQAGLWRARDVVESIERQLAQLYDLLGEAGTFQMRFRDAQDALQLTLEDLKELPPGLPTAEGGNPG